ncbi:hypothetical protein [Montanilutibacter psychrotolerans]|uniref:hypothetical protein n=1 Tax=Montanilutibacter psychrotolerans TaxID=1327343 RepID=UPI0011CD8142|nr:hypothetical protein [Lysobacter psychrotolerans]
MATDSTNVIGLVMSTGVVGAFAGSMLVAASINQARLMLWSLICDAIQSALRLVRERSGFGQSHVAAVGDPGARAIGLIGTTC